MPDKIVILKESGEQVNSNVVSVFLVPESNKKYIITTENATDPHGLTILHVSEIIGDELSKIATEQEWLTIKNIMRSIISGNVGPYQYEKTLEQAKVNGQYYRDISVSATAAKQMADNYQTELKKKADEEKALAKAKKEAEENAAEAPKVEEVPKPEDVVQAPTPEPAPTPAPVIEPVVSPTPEPAPQIKEAEIRQNPETAALNSLEDAEPTPAPSPIKEEPAQKEQEVATIQPSSIFPSDNESVEGNSEVSPGIAEVSDEEEPVTVVEEVDGISEKDIADEGVQENVAPPVVAEATPVDDVRDEKEEIKSDNNSKTTKISIDFTAPASFDPNATLDEVLVGAQEVFLEGVKNLVQTMTEKIYRDYYEKEKELHEREQMLVQREKLLNDQIALINKQFDKEG